MKKQIVLAVALFIAVQTSACAAVNKEKPAWLNNPYAVCAKEEMCAVGIGQGLNSARADARSSIAKVFEARIKSSYEETLSQNNDASSSKIRDYVSESSDVLLQAVEIKETFDTKTEVYALAVLNKPVAARITKEEMNGLDEKMTALLKEDSPAAAVRLEKLYEERRGLNQRYIVLTGSPAMEEVTYDQVYSNKKARIGKRALFLTVAGEPNKAFKQAVRSVLKENGYTFANTASEQTPTVTISFKPDERYSKIDGFVKYAYHFTMKAPDKKGRIVDVLATTIEETGRSEKQAFSNALTSLKAYLNDNILNLNF